MNRARVLIADDHAYVLEGLVNLLKDKFDVVAAVTSGSLLVDAATRLRPDVVVTDISMPGLNGIEAFEQLQAAGLEAKVIVLTLHTDTELAAKLKINDGERVKVVSRRGEGVFPALIVRTIRPDTIFIPYHWGEQLAVNQLTNPKLDPISKIPEFKACAARIEKIHGRELPILGKGRKGTSLSEVQKGK